MSGVIAVITAALLTDNIVLSKLLGLYDVADNEADLLSLVKKCGLLTALMIISSAVVYPLTRFVLVPLGIDYLSALLAVIVILAALSSAFILTKRYLPAVYGFITRNGALLYCSAAALGLCLSSFECETYPLALLYALTAGVGYLLVAVIFYGINHRLQTSDLPDTIKGLPITLIIAALLSVAFGGFAGI